MKQHKTYTLLALLAFLLGFSSCRLGDRYVDKEKSEFFVYTDHGKTISVRIERYWGNGFVLPSIPVGVDYYEVKGADVATFEAIVGYLGKDKNHVYWSNSILTEADVNTFHINSAGVMRDKNHIYDWTHKGTRPRIWEGRDAATYEKLYDYNWARDKNYVFHSYDTLKADVHTFKVFNSSVGYDKDTIYDYGHNRSGKLQKIPVVGKVIRLSDWAFHDDKTMYIYTSSSGKSNTGLNPFPISDASTVKLYASDEDCKYWSADRKVYWADFDMAKRDIDVATFKYLGFNYAKDANQVYYASVRLTEADVNTFKVKEKSLACDKDKVFMHSNIVAGADPQTVHIEQDRQGYDIPVDKNHRYYYDYRGSKEWEIEGKKE